MRDVRSARVLVAIDIAKRKIYSLTLGGKENLEMWRQTMTEWTIE